MSKVNFTATRVADHECEIGKLQSFLWDTAAPGLGLRATIAFDESETDLSRGKSYIFQAKLDGKTLRITIGAPKTWSIEQARAEARRLKVLIDGGKDPRQVRADELNAKQASRDAKHADTDAQAAAAEAQSRELAREETKRDLIARTAWDAYLRHPRPATGKKKWGAQHRAAHAIAANPGGIACKIGDKNAKPAPLATLLAMPLHSITAQVVTDWLVLECLSRPTFAHNCFRKFRTFIGWCAKHPEHMGVVQADCCLADAVKDITPANKTKEGDCLQREQLPDWFDAVRKISSPVISAYLQALLITGARRGEREILTWADVDFRWGSMTIRDKVEGFRTIPLTPYLAQLLAALPRRSEWVFSSPAAASGHITEPRIAHTKALAVAGLPHVSLHGLRRSFGTLSEWVEVPTGVVAQIQGHKPSALAEKHYRRRPPDLLRMWHVKIEAWMLKEAGIVSSSSVPRLKSVVLA